MAITPNGETGRTIQLKRTSLLYNDAKIDAEQLNFGEPLYNDNDKTLLIGDESATQNSALKVIKAVDRNKANSQVYTYGSYQTFDSTSNIANLYNESNQNVYIKNKDWGNFLIDVENITTYSFTVDSNNNIVKGDALSTAFSTLPCLVDIPINGMKSTYVPTVSLFLINSDITSVASTKAKQKAFSCIARVDTYESGVYIVFFKQPAVPFRLNIVGG